MSKDTKILVELVIVLALVGFGLWSMKKNPFVVPNIDNSNQIVSPVTNSAAKTNTPAASLSYAQALAQYKDTRIQLDQNCRATPTSATYKNNSSIMIDNRASVARTVKVGSSFDVKAWGFKIVKLASPISALPATWGVNCDTSQNVATILIQK